jgi:hypothetical protein
MATTTVAAIRDQMIGLVQALTPSSLSAVKFRVDRAELDFREWAAANPASALRRFAITDVGSSEPAEVSNTDVEWRYVTFELVVAYADSGRYGRDYQRDELDVIEQDQHQIEDTIGLRGYGNVTDATFMRDGSETSREKLGAVTFLVVRERLGYYRSV